MTEQAQQVNWGQLFFNIATIVGVLATVIKSWQVERQSRANGAQQTQIIAKVDSNTEITEATETKVDVLSRALAQMIDKDQVFTTVMLDRDWHKRIFEEARRNPNCGECLQQVIEAMDRRKTERRMGDPMRRETDQ